MAITVNNRPNIIDWAKSIGMCCVISGHFVYYFNIPYPPQNDSLEWNWAHFVTLFHMPLFFVISGMLFRKKENQKSEIKKAVNTLLLPYILISIIVMSIYIFIWGFNDKNVNILQFVAGIICGGDLYGKANIYPVGPIWFLYCLFFIKVIYAYVYDKKKIIFTLMLISISVIVINKNFLPFRIDSSFVGFLFFSIGFLLKKMWFRLLNIKSSLNILGLIFSIGLILAIYYTIGSLDAKQGFSINVNYYGPFPILFIVSGIIGTYLIFSVCKVLSLFKMKSVYIFSTGMIIPLGFQKIIMLALYEYMPTIGILTVSVITIILSYILILIFSRYMPIVIGNRKF